MKGHSNGGEMLAQMVHTDGFELSKTVLAALTKGISSPCASDCVSNLTLFIMGTFGSTVRFDMP